MYYCSTCTREGFAAGCVNLVNKFGAIHGAYICVHVYCCCVCMRCTRVHMYESVRNKNHIIAVSHSYCRCDADPAALAKYVVALLRKDKPKSALKELCIDQLEVFLAKGTALVSREGLKSCTSEQRGSKVLH